MGVRKLGKVPLRGVALQLLARVLVTCFGLAAIAAAWAQESASNGGGAGPSTSRETREIMNHVIDGIKQSEHAQNFYERIERVEMRKQSGDAEPMSVRVTRVIPAGTGIAKITVGPDGRPTDTEAYRVELDRLVKSLIWAAETGQPQREAYQKVQKKQKDRDELIEATRTAFIFTFITREERGERTLSKYRMEPNPTFRSTSRATSLFSRVKGFVWVDDESHQLARVQGEVTDDISLKSTRGASSCRTATNLRQGCGCRHSRNMILTEGNFSPVSGYTKKRFTAVTAGSDRRPKLSR
jgi:hypothetical protein